MKKRTFVAVLVVVGAIASVVMENAKADSLAGLTPAQRDSARLHDATMKTLRRRSSDVAFQGKMAIKSRLRDPESAQFGRVWAGGDSQFVACGKVNAKNGFGGYTGEEFYWGVPPLVITSSDVEKLSAKERKAMVATATACDTTYTFSTH
jgi:hypothetical protein